MQRGIVIAVLLLALLSADRAWADRERGLLSFERLEGYRFGASLFLDFRLEPKSWQRLAGQPFQVGLEVRVRSTAPGPKFRQTFTLPVLCPQDRLRIDLPPHLTAVSASLRAVRLDQPGPQERRMSFQGVDVLSAVLVWHERQPPPHPPSCSPGPPPVGPPQPPPPAVGPPPHVGPPHHGVPAPNWAADPRVIGACNKQFFSGGAQQACLQAAAPALHDPEELIRACGEVLYSQDDKLACIRIGAPARMPLVGALRACARLQYGSTNQRACFEAATGAVHDPVPVIQACAEAVFGGGDQLECLRQTLPARYPAADAIRACGQTVNGSRDKLECLRLVAGAPLDPTPTIRACGSAMNDSARLGCLRTALGRK